MLVGLLSRICPRRLCRRGPGDWLAHRGSENLRGERGEGRGGPYQHNIFDIVERHFVRFEDVHCISKSRRRAGDSFFVE